MIKLLVTELPEKPEDCPFSIYSVIHKHDTKPNCLLKHNNSARNPRDEFSCAHDKWTCKPEYCPFLTTQNCISQKG